LQSRCYNRRLTNHKTLIDSLVLCAYPDNSVPLLTNNHYYVCSTQSIPKGRLIAEYCGEYIRAGETHYILCMRIPRFEQEQNGKKIFVKVDPLVKFLIDGSNEQV
jgi:hypothetical protein